MNEVLNRPGRSPVPHGCGLFGDLEGGSVSKKKPFSLLFPLPKKRDKNSILNNPLQNVQFADQL